MSQASMPSFLEDDISKIPALQLLQNLGYVYLAPEEALSQRGGRTSEVLLEGVLTDQLRRMNRITYKGGTYPFSEGNIQAAVQSLKEVTYDGLVRTNEKLYELMTLPKSLPQSIDGDLKSFPLWYIDFKKPSNNVFHVTEEFEVARSGSDDTRRPDLVLFVNGIPLGVIECKRPDLKDPLEQAISQQIRNERDDEIPRLFNYSQLLMAVTKNEALYATAGTEAKYWAKWKKPGEDAEAIRALVNRPLASEQKSRLFAPRKKEIRQYFDEIEAYGRETTEQDRAIYALCRPERLLELTYRFILFDAGVKKIARYQQYFTVKNVLARIHTIGSDGSRPGGVIWHTQGSGKSLTMVMLAHAIALEPDIPDFKVVLVTDRIDLDDQIYKTFLHCGAEVVQARTGKHLGELLQGSKGRIIATILDKFEAALGKANARNESPNIFVLVDEGHRGQYGPLHAKMRKVLPNACFLGFTGTPVVKKEKNTIRQFGGLIPPTYTISQAVEDKAVVPLLYEGRHVEQVVYKEPIDSWFAMVTEELSEEQRADLKHKFASSDQLNKADQKVARVAYDISVHFRGGWKGTGFKGQLVTPDKATALRYKGHLDSFGMVSSEVLISGPDEREGYDDIYGENRDKVVAFWKGMMAKYGSEKQYNKQLINAFKYGDDPEIIIVVDKLLTGFDAPRNTILYLTRSLKEHAILQAIARVNRLYPGKDYGYVLDYWGVLENLDHALDLYGKLADYDPSDLVDTLTDVSAVIDQLPQRHSDLLQVFKDVGNRRDEEAYEILLQDEALRNTFYERLSYYARTLDVALSTVRFISHTPQDRITRYVDDLKFFMSLRTAVRRRYAEVVDFREYEPKIQKLIDTHVGTGEVEKLTGLVNIFDKEAFAQEVEKLTGTTSKADTIAFRTKRTIELRMDEDPAFFKKFSEMLEDAIRAFRERRLSDLEYLNKVREISDAVRDRTGDDLPDELQGRDVAKAYFGVIRDEIRKTLPNPEAKAVSLAASLRVEEIINALRIVHWTSNQDVQNTMRNEIEDYILDLKADHGLTLTLDDMDSLMEQCINIAKVRLP